MDIEVMGRQIRDLLAFKEKIEGLMSGADDHVSKASDTLDDLLAFKAEVQAALPMLEKAALDASSIIADLDAIKKQLEPALEWIAEQQKKNTASSTEASTDKPLEEVSHQGNPPQA